jgi:hypothetical protein
MNTAIAPTMNRGSDANALVAPEVKTTRAAAGVSPGATPIAVRAAGLTGR